MKNVWLVTPGGTEFKEDHEEKQQNKKLSCKFMWESHNRWPLCASRVALLLLVSGFIGLQIMALQERLESLGALAELLLHHNE